MNIFSQQQDPVLAIVGPTASRKSAVAMYLAERLGAEVVSCDSVQVYRGFRIGCAKPTEAELRRVPHHLLDVVAWDEPFDAARYAELARAALSSIRQRGRAAIVCGGTGLYLRSLRYGLAEIAPAPPQLRQALAEEEARHPGAAWRRLQQLDAVSAARIDPRNKVQVLRAVEICLQSGRAASQVRAEHGFSAGDAAVAMTVVVLETAPQLLRAQVLQRAQQMVLDGLLDEVAALLAAGVDPHCRAMGSIGYREAVAVLTGKLSRADLVAHIFARTWQYARRQRTWFRRERSVLPVAVTPHEAGDVAAMAAAVLRQYGRGQPGAAAVRAELPQLVGPGLDKNEGGT